MESIIIGTTCHAKEIKEKLQYNFSDYDDIKIVTQENSKGNLTFVECTLDNKINSIPSDYQRSIFRYYVSNAVSDIIIDNLEDYLIQKIISQDYCYLSPLDQETIVKYTYNNLNKSFEYPCTSQNTKNLISLIKRKKKILSKVLEYLDDSNQLILEGFVSFRLKEYIEELRSAIENSAQSYKVEQEYEEFIQLLKYFVDIQEPKIDEVNVIMKENGSFQLFDDQMKTIDEEYLKDFIYDMIDQDINFEDLLISILITIAPRVIVLHIKPHQKELEIINTIRNVFSGRVFICEGCPMCRL